jgi:photosystem II stability/assembly factor-like uncharacterized protein
VYVNAALAISPREPSRVYAGTNRGVYISTDGGSTWRRGRGNLANVLAVAADPENALVAYAGAPGGVYRTTDGGDTWQLWTDHTFAPGTEVWSVAVIPS